MGGEQSAKRVLDLCDEALRRREEDRESFLTSACANDPNLGTQVRRLLRAIKDSGRFMRVEEADDQR